MKKILITMFFICIMISLYFSNGNIASAEEYTTFESMVFENEDVILMDSWSFERKNAYMNSLNQEGKKMFGWKKFYVYEKEPFDYVAETLYHVKNLGTEEVTHTFKYSETYEETIQRTVTGTLEVEASVDDETKQTGSSSKFKYGLEGQLKFEYKQTKKTKTTEEDTVKITIAPLSELYIKVMGKGYLYQGVARKYFFYIKAKEGGFEYVIITTEYYSIDIEPLGETNEEE